MFWRLLVNHLLLLYLFIFLFSGNVFAATYSWTLSSTGVSGFSSPFLACSSRTYSNGLKSVSATQFNINSFDCNSEYGPGSPGIFDTAIRSGDSCQSGFIYNASTGVCEAPPPDCKVGELFPAKGDDGTVVTSADGRNYVVGSDPPTACYNQCSYSGADTRPSSCYGTPGGVGWCNYVIKSTGENCSADSYTFSESGPQLNSSDTPNVPDSTPNDPLCPKGWGVSNGTCYKLPPEYCDPSTGEVCAPGTTDPDAPPPDPDAPPGTPGGSPDPSDGAADQLEEAEEGAPGDGEACKPKADGSGCGGPTVRGEQCDKVIECTGDAILCATLRQQKKMACAYEYEQARPFIENQIAKDAYKLTTKEVNGSSLFSDGLNAARWMPQGCPAPKAITVKGVSTALSMQPACDFASALGSLFVALASVFFAVYVGRAFGGN
jgi:hypothetical protein